MASVPVLPAFHVERPRLLDLLDTGGDVPLTAVVAPPGAGKSITLAAWIRDRCPDAVWVPCTERDRDPVVFLSNVIVSLRAVQGDRWLEAVELLNERDLDPEDAVDVILKGLEDQAAVIVLDDVHVARDARAALSRLVEQLPMGSRVVTGSRGDPPLAIHRLRADGRCLEVREADLRLSDDEVDELVRALGASLSTDASRLLSARADGWAAGVQMAAIALRNETDPDRFLAEFSGSSRIVSDYLVEEVLARQTEAVQRFLLRTSVLDDLEPDACAAVTGQDDAAAVLRLLDTSALFVIPTGNGTYRYHELFRDMLRYQLWATSRDGARDAHRQAAEWYEGCGAIASALEHLVAAGDEERAFALLQAELVQMTIREGAVAARAAIAAVADSDATLDADRMVAIGFGFSVVGALTSGDAWLQRALRQSDELDDAGRRRLTVARAYLAGQQGDASRAVDLLEDLVPHDSDDDMVVASPAVEVHARVWLADFRGARDAAARSRTLRPLGVAYDEIMVGGALSWAACVEGSLREAAQLADKALATADELSVPDHSMLGESLRTRGWLCFERGDLHGAEVALERSVMLLEKPGPARALVSMAALARVWLSEGRFFDAAQALSTARASLSPEVESPLWAVLDGLDARIALVEGDRERAEAITKALEPSLRRRRLETRLALVAHDPDAALAVLEKCDPVTPRERVDVAMLRARCDDELGAATADGSLAAAVDAARSEGFTFALAEELFPCARRLGGLLRSTPVDDFASAVLALLEHVVPLPEPTVRAALVEPLTDRELVVLRYMTSRLTTSEIASELYISVNTVRTHTKAVYRKLGVASRQDAVAEAHRLGIR